MCKDKFQQYPGKYYIITTWSLAPTPNAMHVASTNKNPKHITQSSAKGSLQQETPATLHAHLHSWHPRAQQRVRRSDSKGPEQHFQGTIQLVLLHAIPLHRVSHGKVAIKGGHCSASRTSRDVLCSLSAGPGSLDVCCIGGRSSLSSLLPARAPSWWGCE